MTILGLDTTSEAGSIAIRSRGRAVAERAIRSPDGFAHVLFDAIEEMVTDCGITLAEVDLFAAASGPGSFTGVRVGLAAMKGLAQATAKPAAGISNLQALASFGNAGLRAVVLDAHRGEVYAAVYDAGLRPVIPETVTKLAEWATTLPDGEYELITAIDAKEFAGTRLEHARVSRPPASIAAAIAFCAEFSEGNDPALLDANYVRRSDAELFWKGG